MKHAYTVVFAAFSVMAGVYWDISWHMSIGRDTFWTPAHLLIQAGGLLAGLSSGWVVLRTTFGGSETERAASVNKAWNVLSDPIQRERYDESPVEALAAAE